ncbi:MAG: CHAT domain-containing protein [Deltaproteobacteria bacterium]|nr:CHAT domain-containing protein [Deltaproteobacteria bacterium]
MSHSYWQRGIQGILPYVTGKEVIIVPHDVLHYLPFHALLSPDGRYLIERYPIYYLSSQLAPIHHSQKEGTGRQGSRVWQPGSG